MTTQAPSIAWPAPSKLLSNFLNTLSYAFSRQNIKANLGVGGELYNRALAYTKQTAIAIASGQLSEDAANPLKAKGQDLINLCAVFGVFPRPAGFASGGGLITCSGPTPIPANFTATIGSQQYKTVQAYTGLTTGADVLIQALVAGPSGNQTGGTLGTWDSAEIGTLQVTFAVDGNGITNGTAADGNPDGTNPAGDDALRQRLLEKLSAPPVGGNWSMLVQTAQDSTADVQGAYGFPGPGGAATATVACTAATANRVPAAGTLNTVRAAIAAVFPGEENINVVGVTPQGVDVTVKLTLPAPIGAGGAGGGWTDPNTWPTEDVRITLWGSNIATISHVSNPPQVGNQIGLWDPSFTDPNTGAVGIMRGPFTVSNVIDVFGTYSIQVTGNFAGFGGTLAGTYISAWAQNIVQYASAIVAEIAKLGPGQITNQPELLPRAFRQPSTDVMFPSDLTVTMLAAALPKSSFPEIGNFDFGVTYLASTTTSVITPPIPDTSMDPPRIFVPSNLAFRVF